VSRADEPVATGRKQEGASSRGLEQALPGLRIGQGFDVHAFAEDPSRPLVLGGVRIPGGTGLAGHSDADVLAHALADALLGASGLGDLGTHFPEDDPAFDGADSMELLATVSSMVLGSGLRVLSADCTVVAERPRLAPYRDQMAGNLSRVLEVPVGVKATSTNGLGALGRSEGIACLAVVLMVHIPTGSSGSVR